MTASLLKRCFLFAVSVLLLGLSSCAPDLGLAPTPTFTSTPSLTPTVTPIPLAVIVNGEGIPQAEFDAELARYQQVQVELGITISPEEAAQVVLDDFIDQLLLAQGANAGGYVVDDPALQARIDALVAGIGGPDVLSAWLADNLYTEADFRSSLRRQMTAAWMRDQVIAAVSPTADQVHVKQILFYNAEDAQNVYALLQSGWVFNDIAAQYDPITRGELGWFPRGYLVHPSIEEAAFALQPGSYSSVVESSVGFHILYLLERDPARPLSPDALLTLQEHALQDWLTQRRNASTIVIAP